MKIAVIPSHFKPFLCLNLKKMGASTNDSSDMILQGEHGSIVCFSTERFTFSRVVLSVLKHSFKCCQLRSNTGRGSAGRRKNKREESNDTNPLNNKKMTSPGLAGLENVNSRTDQTLALASGRDMEVPFNVGVAFGLMYLIAAYKSEFNKMTELKAQIEVLAQDVRNGVFTKEGTASTSTPPQTNTDLSFPVVHNNQKHSAAEMEEEELIGADKMEAELELEFEHLQLNFKSEDYDLKQQNNEMPVIDHSGNVAAETIVGASDDGELIEIDKIHEGEYTCNYEGGVSPRELERRLHVVLEKRQQERIAELEYALECAEKRLHQKEIEASWWKDTASLISQHISCKSEYLSK
ncbi:hypothetical protein Sjap_019076 [Stephania japonica]|uniref:Protein POLAR LOCALIZATION DURING ASYMMETRIC DIVISION AND REDISTRIBUTION-like n=1 Tax=Stephania japonica TaxID=461633 RepID=A0AAP0F3K9_9MAGN